MKFSSIIYFVISINLVLVLSSAAGIWTPEGESTPGQGKDAIITAILFGIGEGTITGVILLVGMMFLGSAFFSTEKVAGLVILGGLYGSLTKLTTGIISTANVSIGTIAIQTVFDVIFFIIFLLFIVQTIFGGFKAYE